MGRIFGTDGARGVVGEEITATLALDIGRAAAQVLISASGEKPLVLIGKDTRISCDMLEAAVAAGLCSVGVDVMYIGVVPSPAVAYLTKKYNASAGVVLSASHNSYEFNGIKLFGSNGLKLTDEQEARIEAIILDGSEPYLIGRDSAVGLVKEPLSGTKDYIDYLSKTYKGGYNGRILVDCANGSASTTAKELFVQINVNADIIFNEPNGININDNCGSTHAKKLATKVIEGKYDIGIAFDGDADRLFAVDEKGNILDGDSLLFILADYLYSQDLLNHKTVVATSMSNLGFFKLMEKRGFNTKATDVGDRYVLECMLKEGYSLGGEQSGHIILLDYATTGDGQLSAIMLLNAVAKIGKPLSEIASEMKRYPQTMVNVTASVEMKLKLKDSKEVNNIIDIWREKLSDNGRVIVRPSGTEPSIRVMVEGESEDIIKAAANEIAEAIRVSL